MSMGNPASGKCSRARPKRCYSVLISRRSPRSRSHDGSTYETSKSAAKRHNTSVRLNRLVGEEASSPSFRLAQIARPSTQIPARRVIDDKVTLKMATALRF